MSFKSFEIFLAQATTPPSVPNTTGSVVQMVGMFAILAFVFYFLTIRPQSQKAKQHAAMMAAIKPGDRVVTSGGVVGVVVNVKDKTVVLRSVETKFEVQKSAVADIQKDSTESAPAESQASKS